MGSIKEIFPCSVFVMLHCEKGIFGIVDGKLFHIDTTVLEQKHGKILQLIFNANAGFFLCEKALLGFGDNQYGQLGLGNKYRQPFRDTLFNSPEELFNNLRPIAQETFDLINKAGKIVKIVNDCANSMIICEQAIFCCGNNHFDHLGFGSQFEHLGFRSNFTEFKLITFNPEQDEQFIQVSMGERHILLLYKNKFDKYALYGCGLNDQRQLGMVDKNFETTEFIKLDFPQNKGKPIMICADFINSYLLCENGLFVAGLDKEEWEQEPFSSVDSSASTDDSGDSWADDKFHPWISLDHQYKMFKEKGEILKIIPDVGVLCEKAMFFLINQKNKLSCYHEQSFEVENSEFLGTAEPLTLKINF